MHRAASVLALALFAACVSVNDAATRVPFFRTVTAAGRTLSDASVLLRANVLSACC